MGKQLRDLVRNGEAYLAGNRYASSSAALYRQTWSQFSSWCRARGLRDPKREDACAFISDMGWDTGANALGTQRMRCVRCLFDLEETGRFPRRYAGPRIAVGESLAPVLGQYARHLESKGVKGRTVGTKLSLLRHFLRFLERSGVSEVQDISVDNVRAYLESLAGDAASTRSGRLYALRDFLRWAVGSRGCDGALARMFPKIPVRRDDVLPSVYSKDEVALIIGSVMEAEGPCALRDRAIFLLAYQEAMRAGDIRELKTPDIDWRGRRLSFVQEKTGERVDLPIAEESLLALADYMKNERPDSADEHVFLVGRAPYGPYGPTLSFSHASCRRFAACGVDVGDRHHGLHALRHSSAVAMLSTSATYPTVSAVLGHAAANTTKGYLRVDAEALRPLGLEVPDA